MTDKTQPEGFSKAKATEGFSKRQETEDDVEGHGFQRTADGFARAKADGDGFARAKATEGFSKRQETEDDVEGHSLLDPFAARELSRARERDVQQHAKRHEFERDARDAKKDRS